MNLDRRGENDLMNRSQALVISERFQKEFGGLADIGKSFFNRGTLRLASLEFRAPCVASVLVLLDHHTDLSCHQLILSRPVARGIAVCFAVTQVLSDKRGRHFPVCP